MDIFIVAPQGAAATAEGLLQQFHGTKLRNERLADTLVVSDPDLVQNVRVLCEAIRSARVSAVWFHNSLDTDGTLLIAVQAVKEARKQTGRDYFAIYAVPSQEVINVAALVIEEESGRLYVKPENTFKS